MNTCQEEEAEAEKEWIYTSEWFAYTPNEFTTSFFPSAFHSFSFFFRDALARLLGRSLLLHLYKWLNSSVCLCYLIPSNVCTSCMKHPLNIHSSSRCYYLLLVLYSVSFMRYSHFIRSSSKYSIEFSRAAKEEEEEEKVIEKAYPNKKLERNRVAQPTSNTLQDATEFRCHFIDCIPPQSWFRFFFRLLLFVNFGIAGGPLRISVCWICVQAKAIWNNNSNNKNSNKKKCYKAWHYVISARWICKSGFYFSCVRSDHRQQERERKNSTCNLRVTTLCDKKGKKRREKRILSVVHPDCFNSLIFFFCFCFCFLCAVFILISDNNFLRLCTH